jgi:3-hydroxyacyl-CoA dehydrogenase
LQRYGFPIGPYRLRDAEGLDPDLARLRRKAANGPSGPPPALEDYLTELGWLGRIAGRGWYRYVDGPGETANDPDVLAVIADERRVTGIEARTISEAEIVARCLDAMANEGARLVRTRQVRVPSDIDVAMLHGAMFPRWRGGPMLAADIGGIPALERRLLHWAKGRDAAFWTPDPLIVDLRKNGRDFAALNGA